MIVGLVLFGLVLPWVVIAIGGLLCFRILVQNGHVLRRLEALEELVDDLGIDKMEVPSEEEGLPAGTEAPAFSLPDLGGRRVALEEFRGRRVLLIFFSPDCGFCQEMGPQLAALPWEGQDGRPIPLIVTTQELEKNRTFMEKHGIRCPVLVQENVARTVRVQYGAVGTPVGYLIDENGVLVTDVTVGAENLLALSDPDYAQEP